MEIGIFNYKQLTEIILCINELYHEDISMLLFDECSSNIMQVPYTSFRIIQNNLYIKDLINLKSVSKLLYNNTFISNRRFIFVDEFAPRNAQMVL